MQQLSNLTALDISRCLQGQQQRSGGSHAAAAADTDADAAPQFSTLLALLQGTTHRQQQQQELLAGVQAQQGSAGQVLTGSSTAAPAAADAAQEAVAGHAAATEPAAAAGQRVSQLSPGSAAIRSASAGHFSTLQRLFCSGLDVSMHAGVWATLPCLSHLDVSCCRQMQGHGLSQLQQLQELVASGECLICCCEVCCIAHQ